MLALGSAIRNKKAEEDQEKSTAKGRKPGTSVHRPPKPFKSMTGAEYMQYLDGIGGLEDIQRN